MRPQHAAHLQALGITPADVEAVLLVGSQADGWATPNSDHDYLVITQDPVRTADTRLEPVPLHPDTLGALSTFSGTQRVEGKFLTSGQIDQMLDRVSWDAFESDHFAGTTPLSKTEEEVLGRIPGGVACCGREWHEQTSARMKDSAYSAFMTTRSLGRADSKLEDVDGFLSAGDAATAALVAREAFGDSVNALLSSIGYYDTWNAKWRLRRVVDARHELVTPAAYLDVMTFGGLPEVGPRAWALRTATRCQEIGALVEICPPALED